MNIEKNKMEKSKIIIYDTADGKAKVTLFAREGLILMNQNQIAELFDTSVQNIGQHIANILKDKELDVVSVVKNYLTTEIKNIYRSSLKNGAIIFSKQRVVAKVLQFLCFFALMLFLVVLM